MLLKIALYIFAGWLILHVIRSIVKTKTFTISDSLATLGIVVAFILAQSTPSSSGPTATSTATIPTPISSSTVTSPSSVAQVPTINTAVTPIPVNAAKILPHDIRILVDETHNEFPSSRISAPRLASLRKDLEKVGYTISSLQAGPITEQNLSSNNVLVILEPFNPPKPFTDQEIEAIKNFVHNGGGLLLVSVGWSWVE